MKRATTLALGVLLAASTAPNAMAWGVYHGAYGGAAYRGPMGGAAATSAAYSAAASPYYYPPPPYYQPYAW